MPASTWDVLLGVGLGGVGALVGVIWALLIGRIRALELRAEAAERAVSDLRVAVARHDEHGDGLQDRLNRMEASIERFSEKLDGFLRRVTPYGGTPKT